VTSAEVACGSCGTKLRANAKFCHACGAAATSASEPAEYKQVTVLFADVVGSMRIASAVGAERLREIVSALVTSATTVVRRYGGMVGSFTGDGIMAVFGAPAALEDHAFRACLAALGIQEETKRLAAEVQARDAVELRLRIGLNSGQVITGETGSGALGYATIGVQVGMAQRMESVAPPGGIALAESTARLVENVAVLGELEMLQIKDRGDGVRVRRLLGVEPRRGRSGRRESTLVGRQWEMNALAGLLDRSIGGDGCVVGVVGPPGIGKSRIAAEIAAIAANSDLEVFSTFCESHASEIPFRAVAQLLRAALGVEGLEQEDARARVRIRIPDAEPTDLLFLDDVLGIRDTTLPLPDIAPDARRRRLTALVNSASLVRTTPVVYIIEDVHWIDQSSERLLTGFLSVVPRIPSLVLITYRPEYSGPLSRTPGGQTIALAPLSHHQTATLVAELLGTDPSLGGLTAQISDRAAGNPFFVEEIVRDLADRGVLHGGPGAYTCPIGASEVEVPATLQVAIAARIDRLEPAAKRTLYAASVIGLRFGVDLLANLVDTTALTGLIEADLIDQVMFTPRAEYSFHHPLIRTVAYGSQLKSERADLHRRLADMIREHHPDSLDENAALIAEHLHAAGDLHEAFEWHMRAGTWSISRDIRAARMSWQRARQAADQLAVDDPARMSMRIAPLRLVCGTSWRVVEKIENTGFEELRQLTGEAGDKVSLAIGMAGQVTVLAIRARFREADLLTSEYVSLIESIGDPTLTLALLYAAMAVKRFTGETAEIMRLAQLCIDLADGDVRKGNLILESPLASAITFRGTARCCLALPGWKSDLRAAFEMARTFNPTMRSLVMMYGFGFALVNGALVADADSLRDTAEMLEAAERSGDDFPLATARFVRGLALVHQDGPDREEGFDLLNQAHDAILREQFSFAMRPVIELHYAKEKLRTGDLAGAIELSRTIVDQEYDSGEMAFRAAAVAVLVESLVAGAADPDVREAEVAVERLAAVPTEPGFVVNEVALLQMRALLARCRGDQQSYRKWRDGYRAKASSIGLEGHIALAEAMP
jgi:adenylate cyclase